MKLIKQAFIFFINIIYPQLCLLCGKLCKKHLCKQCKTRICKDATFKIETINCYFEKHIYIFKYEGEIRNLILSYKFKDKSYLYKLFSEIILKNEKIFGILEKYDIIIPVPIHKKRKKQRGYNQSELIANDLATNIKDLKCENNILIKQKNTLPQSSLNKNQRKNNLKDAYKVINQEKIINKKIILFDDIYTTGSTAKECSKILKASGAKEILVLTISKT